MGLFIVIAVAVVKVSHAGVLTLWAWADLTSLLIAGWRDWRFGVVVEGLEKGALISCLRAGESLDMFAVDDDAVDLLSGVCACACICDGLCA